MGILFLILELFIRSILPPFYSFGLLEKVCKKKLEKNPRDRNVRWFLSNLYIWYGKYSKAKPLLQGLIEEGRDSKSIRLLLSQVHYKVGEFREVVKVLEKPGILSENDKENYYLGESFIEEKKFQEAVPYLKNYIKFHPKNYVVFVRLGYSYYMQEEFDLALKAFRKAEELNPLQREIKDNINLCVVKVTENLG